ncbi:MAG: hypothetical protein MJ007_02000 [Paludibacteraceae bacterium]|nr:hypothetical protein [Paludibacteraceae bacterium]
MASNRWVYYVAVYENDGSLHYVTETNGKCALWRDNDPAKEFSARTADDICEGLNMNLINSIVVKAPSYMHIRNGEREAQND